VVIKFCVDLNKTGSETFDMPHTAYGDDARTEDDQQVGRPKSSKIEENTRTVKGKSSRTED